MRLNSGTATPILCINVPQFHLLLYLFRKSNTHHHEVFFSLHPDQDKIVFLQTEYTAREEKKKKSVTFLLHSMKRNNNINIRLIVISFIFLLWQLSFNPRKVKVILCRKNSCWIQNILIKKTNKQTKALKESVILPMGSKTHRLLIHFNVWWI